MPALSVLISKSVPTEHSKKPPFNTSSILVRSSSLKQFTFLHFPKLYPVSNVPLNRRTSGHWLGTFKTGNENVSSPTSSTLFLFGGFLYFARTCRLHLQDYPEV
jgi:hypothetical protein